eukprot:CAMPEP_0197064320 /NCGR_PEP_ID=MMETSP1384-20130603/158385_1 /TAXON_ID=29189 /ORGANISM="Ammonia sp." /LENGTH=77 /DNA_ID=CAMNT_0042500791 /DNA_START=1 /DNA_END=231 /DNA_ORIENTATION=+
MSMKEISPSKPPQLEAGTLGFALNDDGTEMTQSEDDNEQETAQFVLGLGVDTEPTESQAMFAFDHFDEPEQREPNSK